MQLVSNQMSQPVPTSGIPFSAVFAFGGYIAYINLNREDIRDMPTKVFISTVIMVATVAMGILAEILFTNEM